eukprot:SAG22_NODE_4850_length_1151_cov_0.721483_1_plen_92_part_00
MELGCPAWGGAEPEPGPEVFNPPPTQPSVRKKLALTSTKHKLDGERKNRAGILAQGPDGTKGFHINRAPDVRFVARPKQEKKQVQAKGEGV